MKHLALDYLFFFFVREKVIAGLIQVKHIPSHAQPADALTKPLYVGKLHLTLQGKNSDSNHLFISITFAHTGLSLL